MAVSGKAFDFHLARRIFRYTKPYKGILSLTIVTTLILSLLSIVRPVLVMVAMDKYISEKNEPMLWNITVAMIVLLFFEAILQFVNIYYSSWLGQSIIKDIRVQLFRHISGFRAKYFDNTPIGTLVTRTISDIEAIAEIFSQGFIIILGDIMTLIVYIAAMFIIDWQLSLVVLTTVPLLLFSTWLFKNGVKGAFQEVRTEVAALNTFVQEHITGMNIVQIFNREEEEFEKFRTINARHRDANIKSVWYYSVFFPVVEILSSISIGLLVWYGGKEMLSASLEPGEITFFVMLIFMMFRPIRMLADRINTLQMGMVASERVFKVLDREERIDETGKFIPAEMKGEVEFKNVWFAYNKEEWVLKNISFRVNQGETVALVGATGAGKSSVINLINRSYEYNKGEILVDGVNIREYRLDELRKCTGVVLQDVFLFSDTIANNISLNNPSISRQTVVEAAKKVGVHEFIMKLPENYDYNVMERGSMLSAGQRQLISFIRAYVYNPKILILDEATSSVDTESERLIQFATEKLTEGRTSIVIAHRLATIQKASRILVMDHGAIIESGSHQELLKKGGQYRKLFEMQFSEELKIS